MRIARTIGYAVLVFVLLGVAAGALLLGNAGRGAENEQGVLASLISRALSTPTSQVRIGAVEGALSSDATIHDIVLSDRDGVWLRLDRARIRWRRTALLRRRLEVDALEVGHLEMLRRPIRSPGAVKDADKPLLPELPVKVEVKAFTLTDLDLGQPVLGQALRATATGDTSLGSPAEGLVFNLDGHRLDGAGSFGAALAYVPKGDVLKLKVALDEPAKGLVSKLAHLPGEPPVVFRLVGDGTLDAFKADLDFSAGPTIDSTGTIGMSRSDLGRDLAVQLGGHLGAFLPSIAADVFAGETDLFAHAHLGDDGGVAVDRLALTSHLAKLDAHGTYGADQALDFATSVRAVPDDGQVSHAGGATIRKLVFDASVHGRLKAPRIVASLSLADGRLPQGSLGQLDASFSAVPGGEVTDATTRVALDGTLQAAGLNLSDAALARAIGGSASLVLHGATTMAGEASLPRVEAKTPTLAVSFAGDVSPSRVAGRINGTAPDLSLFGELAGMQLAGRSTLAIDLAGSPKLGTLDARVAADAQGVATGIAAVDRLAGPTVALKGRAVLADGIYTVDDLNAEGAHVAAKVAGTFSPRAAVLTAHVGLPDLAKADARLTGAGSLDAHLTGALESPDVTLVATLDRATAMGRPLPHLALAATAADLRGALKGRVTLEGTVDGKPAKGLVVLERLTPRDRGGWALKTLDVAVGSVTLRGAGALDPHQLVRGSFGLAAGNLDDLSPLALTKLGGSLQLGAILSTPDGGQDLTLTGHGIDLKAAGATIRKFALKAEGRDIHRKPVLDADASVDQAVVAGQAISGVTLSAKGTPARSAIRLAAHAAGFDLDAAGDILPGATTRLDLARFSARRGSRTIALAGPAEMSLADGGVAIRHLALGVGGGRLTVDGRAGRTLDLAVDARAIPLAAADIVMPGLGLSGTLDGGARIGGPASAPNGPYRLEVKRLVAPQSKVAGMPPIDIAANGRLEGRRASLDAKVAAGRGGLLTASGSLPLDASGALDVKVAGKLDAALANPMLGPSGRSVTGSLLLDVRLAGTRASPRLGGSATVSGGTFRDVLLGVKLDAIDAKIAAQGDRLTIERLSAATPAGGTLSGSGRVRIDPAAGFPGEIALRGHNAQLVASSLMTATADLAIDVAGALARNPRVTGRVDLTHVDVAIPDRLPSTLKPIDGIRHVNAPANVRARLALVGKPAKTGAGAKGRPALFDAALDVAVSAPNRIFVRGRGVDAELGGALRVIGSTASPSPSGAFDLRRGKVSALGKTLTFTKGKLTFTGDLMPELDFVAEIDATSMKAQIAVTGPASAPTFAFTSSPELPQDEILSRVLFQKPSGSLSGFQALQLAQAAAQFSGGGDGAFEDMRKSLGLDSLDVGGGTSGGPMLGLSRAISDRVSIGVRTGATADQTGLSADVDVTKHIRLQSDVRSNGSTAVGVGTELEY